MKNLREQYKRFSNIKTIHFGYPILDDSIISDTIVQLPLRMLNRHGLIAGSTGSGKTKTVQMITEQLSDHGVPTFHLDMKGDLSGMAGIGEKNGFIEKRYKEFGIEYKPSKFPVSLFSISDDFGYNMKYNVSTFGAVFLSKTLGLNGTQEGLMMVLFKFAGDENIALESLEDLCSLIIYATEEDGAILISERYGRMSSASLSTILRKIIGFRDNGGDYIFGSDSFNMNSLLQHDLQGKGYINILRVTDIQNKQEMFSAFLLKLLMYIYDNMPEVGDLEKPKFVMFIDEAHLIFKQSSKSLILQIESIVKLIRSKGVGIIFCTQTPDDIPSSVLGQLGLKVQHSLRAFTANDRKAIKRASQNYPISTVYDIEKLMTTLNIAEAIVTGLDLKGNPTDVVHTALMAPRSSMNILSDIELQVFCNQQNDMLKSYATPVGKKTPVSEYKEFHKPIVMQENDCSVTMDSFETWEDYRDFAFGKGSENDKVANVISKSKWQLHHRIFPVTMNGEMKLI